MLTLEEIKALEYCVGNVTPIGVPQARMLVLAADALKRERTELENGAASKLVPEAEWKKQLDEIVEAFKRQNEKKPSWFPQVPVPMPHYPSPGYPLPGQPYRVGDFPNTNHPVTTCGGPTTTDFPRTG